MNKDLLISFSFSLVDLADEIEEDKYESTEYYYDFQKLKIKYKCDDEIQLIFKCIDQNNHLGSITFQSNQLFQQPSKKTFEQWITLFDDYEDDIFDGDLGEDDVEVPRVKITFYLEPITNTNSMNVSPTKDLIFIDPQQCDNMMMVMQSPKFNDVVANLQQQNITTNFSAKNEQDSQINISQNTSVEYKNENLKSQYEKALIKKIDNLILHSKDNYKKGLINDILIYIKLHDDINKILQINEYPTNQSLELQILEEILGIKQENENLKLQLDFIQEERLQLLQEIKKLQDKPFHQENLQIIQDYSTLQNKLKQIQNEIEERDIQIGLLQQNYEEQIYKLNEINIQLVDKNQKEKQNFQEVIIQLQNQLEQINSLNRLQIKYDDTQNQHQLYNDLQEEFNDLQQKYSAKLIEEEKLHQKISTQQKENVQLNIQIKQLNVQNEQNHTEIQHLNEQIKNIKQNQQYTYQQLEQIEIQQIDTINQYTNQIHCLEIQYQIAQEDNNKLKNQLNDIRVLVSQLQNQLEIQTNQQNQVLGIVDIIQYQKSKQEIFLLENSESVINCINILQKQEQALLLDMVHFQSSEYLKHLYKSILTQVEEQNIIEIYQIELEKNNAFIQQFNQNLIQKDLQIQQLNNQIQKYTEVDKEKEILHRQLVKLTSEFIKLMNINTEKTSIIQTLKEKIINLSNQIMNLPSFKNNNEFIDKLIEKYLKDYESTLKITKISNELYKIKGEITWIRQLDNEVIVTTQRGLNYLFKDICDLNDFPDTSADLKNLKIQKNTENWLIDDQIINYNESKFDKKTPETEQKQNKKKLIKDSKLQNSRQLQIEDKKKFRPSTPRNPSLSPLSKKSDQNPKKLFPK